MQLIEAVTGIHHALCAAERPIRILRSLAWPAATREQFLATQGNAYPDVQYAAFNAQDTLTDIAAIRNKISRQIGNNPIADWLRRLSSKVEQGALLLQYTGQAEFLTHSTALYGEPSGTLPDGVTSVLALAQNFDATLDKLAGLELDLPQQSISARQLAATMRKAVKQRFGEQAPRIEISKELSANALAGPSRIRIRSGARFSDKDVAQLIQHEAFIHVATALNGRSQQHLPMLARSHAGTTRTQEGLAVFAEFITGSMELDRLRRLTDRVIAIQMAIEGADFIQVYEFFLQRTEGRTVQAYENTRRVFRGGVLTGGAPFTKDIVYLEGLLRVHNFLRISVSAGRADLLRLLFCGKLDIEDISAIAELAAAGYCQPPRFLPPWADDLRFLLSYLAYSSFLNTVNLSALREHYTGLMRDAPVATGF